MSAITLETAREYLQAWLEAEMAVSTGQSYRIGTQQLQRADLGLISQRIEYWSKKVNELERVSQGKSGRRGYRVLIRDL